MPDWHSREHARVEVGFNKKVLKRLADDAAAIKNRLKREYDEAKRKLEAQEAVQKRVREEYMNYMYQARRWEMANAPPPMGGVVHERTWDVTYQAEPKLSRPVTIYSPWLTAAQGGLVERNRTVAPDALSSESEDEPLNERRERMARDESNEDTNSESESYDSDGEPRGPRVAPERQAERDRLSNKFRAARRAALARRAPAGGWPGASPNAAMDGGEEDEGPEVAVMGQRTWKQRDDALRREAIPLDSCVDQVFRKLGLEVYKQ